MRLMQDVLSEHVNMSAGFGSASLMNVIENWEENENGRYKKWGYWDIWGLLFSQQAADSLIRD